jgi:hypothetical protein
MPAKKPAQKRKPKQDDSEQSARFIATGKALGANKDSEALGRALKKVTNASQKGRG